MPDDHISRKRAVYRIAGMEHALVLKDVVYRTTDAGPLTVDVYSPADAGEGVPRPAVVLVTGYSDAGFEKMLGARFKEMAMSVSWGQLIAASGLVAIAYENREPAVDLDALLLYVRENAASLNIDADRIGLWACSGHVPLALSALMRLRLRCGALLYGYMLDLDGATGVEESAQMFRFANPNSGRTLDDLPADLALFIVRAGQEQFPHLNNSIDRFVAKALALNRPITVVNYATGTHSFDLLQDCEDSRAIIRQSLEFLRAQLTPRGLRSADAPSRPRERPARGIH